VRSAYTDSAYAGFLDLFLYFLDSFNYLNSNYFTIYRGSYLRFSYFTYSFLYHIYYLGGTSRVREALADPKINASRTMDSYLHAVSDISSYYPSSETKINLRKKVKSRSITGRDEPL
jgi:hypothetical protein